jgi:2-oxoisovalerate dehydrogenase E2 component (dihydrolipoyl transacylase)
MGIAPIKMPQLGESVTEGTVDRWLKREGDHVKRDEPIVEVVTDKVNAEIPSPFEGRLVRISVAEGTTVPIGVEIAQMEVEAAEPEPAPGLAGPEAPREVAPGAPEPVEAGAARAAEPPAVEGGQRARLSPAVRRLAQEHGLEPEELSQIHGTGLGGRVTRDDLLAYLERREPAAPAGPPAAAPAPAAPRPAPSVGAPAPAAPIPPDGAREELVPLTAMRRSIAEHMTRSVTTSPHAWTLQEVDVSELVRYREAEKDGFRRRHGVPLTYLPFVIQVLCDALKEFPYLNSSWTDEGILLKRYVNLGIAVALPDGLIVPVIKDADRLGFSDLARAAHDLAERARTRKLTVDEVQGGTFTLNNTGALGSIASQPIINQPQAAILTTEAIVRRPVVRDGQIVARDVMNICLSFDHRVLDGLTVSQFVNSMKGRLEAWTPADIRI